MPPFKKKRGFESESKLSSYPCFYYSTPFLKKDNRTKGLFLFLGIATFLILGFFLIVFVGQIENNYIYNYHKKQDPNIAILTFIKEFAVGEEEIDWSLFLLAWNRVQEYFI